MNELQPTIFHLTHIKAGSRWVTRVLRECAPHREVPGMHHFRDLFGQPIRPGGLYTSAYISKEWFKQMVEFQFGFNTLTLQHFAKRPRPLLFNWWNFQIKKYPIRYFIVIRDLRDTLVSQYFSLKHSHEILNPKMAERREVLKASSVEDGLLYLIDETADRIADKQLSWIKDEGLLIRFEELIKNQYEIFSQIITHCEISISPQKLGQVLIQQSFEQASGRKPGEEDIRNHLRKGVAGDWENHFTQNVKEAFKKKYAKLLIETGYEMDDTW